MIQVENEVGMHGDTRDRSPAANQAFAGPVPKELMDYLQQHKDTLIPEFRQVWEAAGFKTSGTWEEVFGQGTATDEIFMAWILRATSAGWPRRAKPNTRCRCTSTPRCTDSSIADTAAGTEPAASWISRGGPMPDVMDIWRAGAPQIDILSPDTYGTTSRRCAPSTTDPGTRCSYPRPGAGRKAQPECSTPSDAIMRSVTRLWGSTEAGTPDPDLTAAYDLVSQLAPLISAHQGNGTMSAVLLRGPNDPPQKVRVGNYTLEAAFTSPPKNCRRNRRRRERRPPAAAIFIAAGPDEYFVAGSGVSRQLFSQHTGAAAGRIGDRGRRRFCQRPLGGRPPAGRRRQR